MMMLAVSEVMLAVSVVMVVITDITDTAVTASTVMEMIVVMLAVSVMVVMMMMMMMMVVVVVVVPNLHQKESNMPKGRKLTYPVSDSDDSAAVGDDESQISEDSAPHTNKKKKVKVSIPKTRDTVRASAPASKKPQAQLDAEEVDRVEIVLQMGVDSQPRSTPMVPTPIMPLDGVTPSSGKKETPDHRKGSIPFRLQNHYDVGLKQEETGDRTITCKLCPADHPLRTFTIKKGQGFGNVGGHFKNHQNKEFLALGCCEKQHPSVEMAGVEPVNEVE